jgi:hypothetical protein
MNHAFGHSVVVGLLKTHLGRWGRFLKFAKRSGDPEALINTKCMNFLTVPVGNFLPIQPKQHTIARVFGSAARCGNPRQTASGRDRR